jgi:excisionase family DNA binding protein
MAAASPTLLTPEEAAAIARCSVKTVRRAYTTGALTAYRRRGSRAVLLDNQDVLAWVQGQIVQPTTSPTPQLESMPARARPRKTARQVDEAARTPKLGSQVRFDLSPDALRDRRRLKKEQTFL